MIHFSLQRLCNNCCENLLIRGYTIYSCKIHINLYKPQDKLDPKEDSKLIDQPKYVKLSALFITSDI